MIVKGKKSILGQTINIHTYTRILEYMHTCQDARMLG